MKDLTGTTTVHCLSLGVYTASRVISRGNMCIPFGISSALWISTGLIHIIRIKEQSPNPTKIPWICTCWCKLWHCLASGLLLKQLILPQIHREVNFVSIYESLTSVSCTWLSQDIPFQIFLTLNFFLKQKGKKDRNERSFHSTSKDTHWWNGSNNSECCNFLSMHFRTGKIQQVYFSGAK